MSVPRCWCTDDGNGLDRTRIRARAEENGLVAPGAKLSDSELYQLIFQPGFSTAKEVTSLSGRGVGMDVVKRTIDGLRGTIDIASTPGRGSAITLRLPLTLAIIDGLLVRVGRGRYVIPLSAVEECVELSTDEDARSRGRSFLNIRGDLVPFLRLRELFNGSMLADRYQRWWSFLRRATRRAGRRSGHRRPPDGDQVAVETPCGRRNIFRRNDPCDGTIALILDTVHLSNTGSSTKSD